MFPFIFSTQDVLLSVPDSSEFHMMFVVTKTTRSMLIFTRFKVLSTPAYESIIKEVSFEIVPVKFTFETVPCVDVFLKSKALPFHCWAI